MTILIIILILILILISISADAEIVLPTYPGDNVKDNFIEAKKIAIKTGKTVVFEHNSGICRVTKKSKLNSFIKEFNKNVKNKG